MDLIPSSSLVLYQPMSRITNLFPATPPQHPGLDYADPTRSYVFAVDGRGRKLTDMMGITQYLVESGVCMSEFNVIKVCTPECCSIPPPFKASFSNLQAVVMHPPSDPCME